MKKIVIVDDEDDIREVLRHALELSKDWEILDAADGVAALDLIQRENPDAVVLDVMMPRMGGRELLMKLRAEPQTSELPVIFLTASLQRQDVRALEALGPKAVLAKPFDPLTIADEIAEVLGWTNS